MLKSLMNRLRQVKSRDDGVTALEYALLAALIAVAIIGGATAVGSSANQKFQDISTEIAKAR
jgi:pilus assembly protein Flp/PilA